MIIVKIQHGLGNQMFQYAFGRRMAEKNKTKLKLDISYYAHQNKNDIPRKYSLTYFNIIENFVEKEDLATFSVHNFSGANIITRLKRKFLKKLEDKKQVQERSYIAEAGNFCEKILKNKNIYLYGSWQNEKYFKDVEGIIRQEFTLKNGFGKKATDIAEKIKNSHAISIHIRRDDYVNNKKTNKYHGLCPVDYYKKAIYIIKQKIQFPTFFVFSDDIDWVKKNLKINSSTFFVSDKKLKDYKELILMSKCKHNIIANSSFSWWGAWLNNNPNKMVIAPKKWFQATTRINDNPCPKSWIKI